jgi:polar amino acid transport system substrate-binding protein
MGMRKSLVVASIALLVCGSVSAAEFLTEENPPLNFSEKNVVTGVATGVVREMAKRAGVPANISLLPWTEAYSRALNEPDTCVYSTARLPSRANQFIWVGPIARGYWSVFALEAFPDKPQNVEELKKYRIGVVRDARAEYLKTRGFTSLMEFDNDRSIPGRLSLEQKPGTVDFWVTQGYSARAIAKAAGVPAIKEVFSALMSQDYWLACNPKMAPDQVKALQAGLSEMRKDGSFRKLADPKILGGEQ